MDAITLAVDLAKRVFRLAVADSHWRGDRIPSTHPTAIRALVRQSQRLAGHHESSGSAHHRAPWLSALGIEVRLLPPAYPRAYVRRNKTDAADAHASLEAARAADIADGGKP